MKRIVSLLVIISMTSAANISSAGETPPTSALDKLFAAFDRPGSPGATVMVIRDGSVLCSRGYGFADVEQKQPCKPETNFRLASVSKQFTAMAILMLAEKKQLSLGERLTDFFPEFPAYGGEITVRHLLSHTSGLLDYEDLIPQGTTIPVLDRDVLRLLMREDKTYFPPGSKYRYSNSAYALLALMVEKRSGQTFAHFLKARIFEPLKMSGTLAYEQGISRVSNRAFGYSAAAEGFTRTDQSLTSSVLGDGGIYSSVADLLNWDQALYTGKLVSRKMLDLAFTPGPQTDMPGTCYGFGWYIGSYRGVKEVWHRGSSRGFTTRISRLPERRFTVIILTNRDEADIAELPHRIADRFLFLDSGRTE